MQQEQAHAGLLVVFGMPGEQQTLGKIVAVNPARAKVETLESRGGRPVGTRFNVPYHLIRPADGEQSSTVEEVELQKTKLRNSF